MLCQVEFIKVSLAPTSGCHTEPNWHSMHLGTEIPAIHTDSCREILQTAYFCATSGKAQKAGHRSESRNLPGALPFAPGREQAVGVYHLLLQPASFPSSCLPFTGHRPYYSFAVLGDCFILAYETSLCVFRKQKSSCFTGFVVIVGCKHECISGVAASLYCREVTAWFKTQQLKGTKKAE